MGSGSSKPAEVKTPSFTPDYSTATFSAADVQRQLEAATAKAQEGIKSATEATTAAVTGSYWWVKWVVGFLGITAVVFLALFIYDAFAPASWPNILTPKRFESGTPPPPLTPATPDIPPKSQSSPAPVAAPPPTVASKIYNAIFGDSSGELSPSFHDATSSAIIQGKQAPLSSDDQGGYGMQWWMYIKDWNYGYGKNKSVIKRPDPTNTSVVNPHISLHPTDNTLQVSVSIYPATEGGASKSTPAPAGHSGSTDDVFVCDVPNIPLQTWFSVSVTVFGRNLDIYIDGKLVKSCFLTGVPKPAVGDIQLTPEGGFSGRICGLNHYPRMLTPGDATTFYNAGTSCKSKTESGIASKATGYSVKFGVYDTLGKEVQEYTF